MQRPEPVRFSFEIHGDPTRGWVLGFVGTSGERMEVSVAQRGARREPAFATLPVTWPSGSSDREPAAEFAECVCPADCPRDHPNE